MEGQIKLQTLRGPLLESFCLGRAVVSTASGHALYNVGKMGDSIPILACGHPLQLAAILSQNPSILPSDESYLALAMGNCQASPEQLEGLKDMASRFGFSEEDLQCGRMGFRHSCAGFHSILLAMAKNMSLKPKSYRDPQGKVCCTLLDAQLRFLRKLRTEVTIVMDDCGLPSLGLTLLEIASSYAAFADPSAVSVEHRRALAKLVAALRTAPECFAPKDTLEGAILEASEGKLLLRFAENGLATATSFDRGWGIALKSEDGSPRSCEIMLLRLLVEMGLVPNGRAESLLELRLRVRNPRGDYCGERRIRAELKSARS